MITLNKEKEFRIEVDKRLVSIENYLRSLPHVKPQHIPAMISFAAPLKVATVAKWEELFSKY